jgi:hypothetical protein
MMANILESERGNKGREVRLELTCAILGCAVSFVLEI